MSTTFTEAEIENIKGHLEFFGCGLLPAGKGEDDAYDLAYCFARELSKALGLEFIDPYVGFKRIVDQNKANMEKEERNA